MGGKDRAAPHCGSKSRQRARNYVIIYRKTAEESNIRLSRRRRSLRATTEMTSVKLLMALLGLASRAAATLRDGNHAVSVSNRRRADTTSSNSLAGNEITTPGRCNSWTQTALSGNITEGKRWEYGYPDFSKGTKVRVSVLTCTSATERRVRVGPFNTRAGGTYDVTSALIYSLFNIGDRITSFTALPVTHLGEPVGYPPLYVHHIHVGRLTDFYDEHWFTSHGDFPIGNDFGIGARSTKGYTTSLPDGYCFAVDCELPFAVQAIIQDMRSVLSAPELSIYVEVNFGLAPLEAATEPATLVWNEAPHGPFGYSRFAVLGEPTMSWWTMRWPASGELFPSARLHSHYARHYRLFLIDGAPETLANFGSHVRNIEYLHDSIPPTSGHETMLLVNLSHTEQTFSQLPSTMCQDDANSPGYIVAAYPGHPNASLWARYREFVCARQEVHEGHVSTFVQLYKALVQAEVRLYPMHTNTWFYMRMPGATSSSDFKAVSYRYATYRTTSISEPIQDTRHGSCNGKLSPTAVANYVSNNAATLTRAVTAKKDGGDWGKAAIDAAAIEGAAPHLVSEADGKSDGIVAGVTSSVALLSPFVGLLLVGLLLVVREARVPTLL